MRGLSGRILPPKQAQSFHTRKIAQKTIPSSSAQGFPAGIRPPVDTCSVLVARNDTATFRFSKVPTTLQSVDRHSPNGILYRGRTVISTPPNPSHMVLMDPSLNSNPLVGYSKLQWESIVVEDLYTPNMDNIPMLNHKLRRVLFSRGIHPLRDPFTNKIRFGDFPFKIQPPPSTPVRSSFIPPVYDPKLHQLAVANKCIFKGSTSSLSPVLSQIYLSLSRMKPVNTTCLSERYKDEPTSHTKTSCRPRPFILRYHNETYSIDSDVCPIPARNQILMNLGKSMESMLTTNPDKTSGVPENDFGEDPLGNDVELNNSFHYMRVGDIIFRSQLDCHDPGLPPNRRVFDLKTRATKAIRLNIDNYEPFRNYKITSLKGFSNSYEREFYDMARSTFLRHSFQTKMGKMAGVFIAYHNTKEIYGFEFVNADEIDRCVFGLSHIADKMFCITQGILSKLLHRITQDFPNRTCRILIVPRIKHGKSSHATTDVYIQSLQPETNLSPLQTKDNNKSTKSDNHKAENISRYIMRIALSINQKLIVNGTLPDFASTDKLDVFYKIDRDNSQPSNIYQDYVKATVANKIYLSM